MIRLNQQKSDTMKNKIYENVLMLSHCAPPRPLETAEGATLDRVKGAPGFML